MRIGQVIGTVTASVRDASLHGGRFIVISPLDCAQLEQISQGKELDCFSPEPSLIGWDELGAGEGQIIGFVEGAEATAPFDRPIPLDALCVALLDVIEYHPDPRTNS